MYCVTAEVRAKRPRAPGILVKAGFMEHVEEVMAKDFKEKANQYVSLSLVFNYVSLFCFHSIVTLRLASADANRIATSFTQFTIELNQSCVTSFLQLIDMADQQMTASRSGTLRAQRIHDHLCRKVTFVLI